MRNYLKEIMDILEYPEEAKQSLLSDYSVIMSSEKDRSLFEKYLGAYSRDEKIDWNGMLSELSDNISDIHEYSSHLLIFLLMTEHLRELYIKKGISLEIWKESVSDLRWKLMECHKMYGIWGSFVAQWFPGFFEVTRFSLGRLQFELLKSDKEYHIGPYTVNPGDDVINVHIPSCGKLLEEDVNASFRQAEEFFREYKRNDGLTVFVSFSWLLFPPHREMLGPDSNIVRFLNHFTIITVYDDPKYGDFWRIFYKPFGTPVSELENRTTLEKGYIERIGKGLPGGYGSGMILFKDGEYVNEPYRIL